MAITQNIFLNSDEIRNNASRIEKYNNDINDCLNDFKLIMGQIDGVWESQGSSELRHKFDELKPDFDKFYSYMNRVVKFLNQNVATDAETLDAAIRSNAVSLQSRT